MSCCSIIEIVHKCNLAIHACEPVCLVNSAYGKHQIMIYLRKQPLSKTFFRRYRMNEQSSTQQSAMVPPEQASAQRNTTISSTQDTNTGNATSKTLPESTEVAATEHRQAYGTSKTENLRDSGLWRIILPAFLRIVTGCAMRYSKSSPRSRATASAAIELGSTALRLDSAFPCCIIAMGAAIVIWGLLKIFMTQAGNYPS